MPQKIQPADRKSSKQLTESPWCSNPLPIIQFRKQAVYKGHPSSRFTQLISDSGGKKKEKSRPSIQEIKNLSYLHSLWLTRLISNREKNAHPPGAKGLRLGTETWKAASRCHSSKKGAPVREDDLRPDIPRTMDGVDCVVNPYKTPSIHFFRPIHAAPVVVDEIKRLSRPKQRKKKRGIPICVPLKAENTLQSRQQISRPRRHIKNLVALK
ncbi:hypothetical protein CEXT_400331 [Caerostris extrusa]|uniref:Uncharacterized protein n=1 Tax=Caerostris extrusa TaxID=172846 RepID=A0AAV4Q6C0_CAEEX|nr:hypothetical protein CEXT_400331 [Caerostris extrusa]